MKKLVLSLTILFALVLGAKAQQGDLVINPDTLWFYHNGDIEYFTVTNEYNYPVQIDSMVSNLEKAYRSTSASPIL